MKTLLVLWAAALSWSVNAQIVSENVSFAHGGCNFQATLTRPPGNGPFPGIVIIPGSGQNDRQGTIHLSGGNVTCLYPALAGDTIEIYRALAEQFSDSGYAVLRYDELFISCPNYSGNLDYQTIMLPGQSAMNYLKSRQEIDTTRLYFIGHSEGAALINYMASQRNDIRGLVSLAGSRSPFDSILARQMVDLARQCNGDTAQAKMQAQQILAYFSLVRSGNYHSNTPPFGGMAASEWHKYINVNDSVNQYYQGSGSPALFIGLGLDFNVPPSEIDRFERELNGPFDFYRIPGLTHYLCPDTLAEVAPQVADTIVHWLRSQYFGFHHHEAPQFEVYPNPLQRKLNLHWPDAGMEFKSLALYNLAGKQIWSVDSVSAKREFYQFSLPEINSGVYVLHINTGQRQFHTKVQISPQP